MNITLFSKKKENSVKFKDVTANYNQSVNDIDYQLGLMSKRDYVRSKKFKTVNRDSKGIVFYIDFVGDTEASAVDHLSETVQKIKAYKRKYPESNIVSLVRITSPGGEVTAYGHASSLLVSLKEASTVVAVVDKVAASGGYMMASVCDEIVVNPVAYLGSIGVVSEFPNLNEVITRLGVQWLEMTAGDSKRSLTPMGEVTDKKKAGTQERLDQIHEVFRSHVKKYRPEVDIESVGQGKVYLGEESVECGLADEVSNSVDKLEHYVEEGYVILQAEFPKNDTNKSMLSGMAKTLLNNVTFNLK